MNTRIRRGFRDNRGQNLVEFAVGIILTLAMLFAVIEFGRMMLVYTTLVNAARIGVRYAMVNGSDTSTTTTQITNVVNDYLSAAPIATSGSGAATVSVSYPASGATTPGNPVEVTVSYTYQPMLNYFGHLNVTLSTQSEGVITF